MSIASHLSVYLRYLDSMNRPLLQYIIELFNEKLSSNIQYVFIMEVRCPLLVTCLYRSQIFRQRLDVHC